MSKKSVYKPIPCRFEFIRTVRINWNIRQSGITLIELIISMVIISISLTGIFTVMNLTVSHSADPVIYHQAISIAEACIEEILLEPYASLSDCSLSNVPANYNVSSSISAESPLSGVPAKKILVTVTSGSTSIELTGYRTNY
ncbi:MAG: prepilin-type N-terminal cleavage/methylation domain-containing protein [Methylococcaceae bacterium]|nr:prepilin-type N-terminal cleavage/methylation domain-containing protein [Methylococcaceae bacterium]